MGFRTEIRTRHVDLVLKITLDTSILIALFKAVWTWESAVWTGKTAV